MLRDRRKSLTLERRSPPPDQSRLQRGSERRGSFAAPSNSLLHPPSEPRHHERRGSLVTRWFKHISEAAEAYKQRDGRNRRADAAAAAAAAAQHDLDASEHPDKTKDVDDSTTTPSGADLLSPPRATNGHGHDESPSPNSESTPLLPSPSPSPSPAPSHPDTPESIARRMEKLRRKDEAIKQALAEKQQLVADILHVPKDEFDTIAEIAGEPATEKEASELILAAVNQANQLSAMVNEALRVTEEDAVSAGVMTSSSRSRTPTSAGVPAHRLNAIATSLNAQLTQLLSVLVQRDDERERLRRELQRSREQLHALHEQRASQGHDDQLTREPGAASLEACLEATLEEANHTGEETDPASSNNPVSESAIASTTAQEVFVDALSGEAESHLEAAGAAEGETLAPTRTADSAD